MVILKELMLFKTFCFSSPEPKVYMSELIVYKQNRKEILLGLKHTSSSSNICRHPPSVRRRHLSIRLSSAFSNDISSEAMKSILTIFHI